MMKKAVQFETNVRSIDPRCPLQAVVLTDDYFGGQTLSPEEAVAAGIDLSLVPDFGTDGQTLGEEVWAIEKVQEAIQMGGERILIENQDIYLKNERIKRNYQIDMSLIDAASRGLVEIQKSDPVPYSIGRTEEFVIAPNENIRIMPSPCRFSEGVFPNLSACQLEFYTNKGKVLPLCNFLVEPVRREKEINKDGKQVALRYVLRILFLNNSPIMIRITEAELNNFSTTIRKYVDAAVISTEVKSSNQKLANFVRSLLPQMQEADQILYCDHGWQMIDGQIVYGMDGREQRPGVCFKTERRLVIDNTMTKGMIWKYVVQMFQISPEKTIGAYSVTYSFLGILCGIFEQAGFPIKFTLNLIGTTGALKTELAKVLYLIFNRDEEVTLHTFTDTATAHELYLASLKDEVGLIDDLELGDSQREATRQCEVYNDLVRKIGEGKGKNRSNSNLENVIGRRTRGLIAVTGEQVIGKKSTRLRTVEVEISTGVIDGSILAVFQRDYRIWPTVIWHFIQYAEKNYQNICGRIVYNFTILRNELLESRSLKRQVDQVIAFITTLEIIENFAESFCDIPHDEALKFIENLKSTIFEAYESADVVVESVNPGVRFLLAVDEMINTGKITISSHRDSYTMGAVGYEENGDLFLRAQEVYEAVIRYENVVNRSFPFDLRICLKALWELEVIERFPNGKNFTFLTKITLNGKRQTAIRVKKQKMDEVVSKYSVL